MMLEDCASRARPTLNPVLEGVRGSGLAEEAKRRKDQEEGAEDLTTSLNRVHASFLFLRRHEAAVQQFCRHLDATPAHILNNSWNALVVELGLDSKIIGCVHNMRDVSYTELILKSYASMPDASLGNLIRAVKHIDRMDAFIALQKNFEEIATEHGGTGQDVDSGFSSIDTESGSEPHMQMVYPDFTDIRSQWRKGLPFTLRHLAEGNIEERFKIHEPSRVRHREENRLQGAAVIRESLTDTPAGTSMAIPNAPKPESPACKVLITFADDGKSLAADITKVLRQSVGRRPQIGVLTLDEHWDIVLKNPEEFIMKWFRRVNYVIPILTEGYLKAISIKPISSVSEVESSVRSLDVEYASFIKDLANKYYTGNRCLNDKIRCVVPMKKRSVLNHMRCKTDPLLRSYKYDTEIEDLARRMTKTYGREDDSDEKRSIQELPHHVNIPQGKIT